MYFLYTTDLRATTQGTIEQNDTIDDCTKTLERPIDWDRLVLEHPGFDDEIFQRIANRYPNIVPVCHEKRTWFETMIAVTDWTPRRFAVGSVENRTAIINHFTQNFLCIFLSPCFCDITIYS